MPKGAFSRIQGSLLVRHDETMHMFRMYALRHSNEVHEPNALGTYIISKRVACLSSRRGLRRRETSRGGALGYETVIGFALDRFKGENGDH